MDRIGRVHRLNPIDEEGRGNGQPVGVLRIVCSDGLV